MATRPSRGTWLRRPTIPIGNPPQLVMAAGTFVAQSSNTPFAPSGTSASGGVPGYTYAWTLFSKPTGSSKTSADIVGASNPNFTSFTPDYPGRYSFALAVTDALGTMVSQRSDILVGDLGSDNRYWIKKTIDCALEAASDWKVGAHTLAGYAVSFVNQGACSTFGPDGATGIVCVPNAGVNWHSTGRTAPCWALVLSSIFPAYASGHGVCVTADWSGAYTSDNQGFVTAIEKTGLAASAWATRLDSLRLGGAGTACCRGEHLSGGSSVTRDSPAGISVVRHQLVRWSDQDVSLGYSTTLVPTSPVPGDASITLLPSSNHLGLQRTLGCGDAIQFAPATDLVTFAAMSWGAGTPTYKLVRVTLHWRP